MLSLAASLPIRHSRILRAQSYTSLSPCLGNARANSVHDSPDLIVPRVEENCTYAEVLAKRQKLLLQREESRNQNRLKILSYNRRQLRQAALGSVAGISLTSTTAVSLS